MHLASIASTGTDNGITVTGQTASVLVSFPSLVSLSVADGRALYLQGNAKLTLEFGLLATVDSRAGSSSCIEVAGNADAFDAVFPELASITCRGGSGGIFFDGNNRLLSMAFPVLRTIQAAGAGVWINGNPELAAVAFPSLESVAASGMGLAFGSNALLK